MDGYDVLTIIGSPGIFDQHRTTSLSKQVGAMEIACRRLHGEQFSLEEELRRLFDLSFVWSPNARFDEALTFYKEEHPGEGTLADRFVGSVSSVSWLNNGILQR